MRKKFLFLIFFLGVQFTFSFAQSITNSTAQAYFKQGRILDGQGKYSLAIVEYTKAIQIDPQYADAYCERGAGYHELGDKDNAIADYTKSIELCPDCSQGVVYFNRGLLYRDKGLFKEAISDFTHALTLCSGVVCFKPYLRRGMAYFAKGYYDNAISDLEKARKMLPEGDYVPVYTGDAAKFTPWTVSEISEVSDTLADAYKRRDLIKAKSR